MKNLVLSSFLLLFCLSSPAQQKSETNLIPSWKVSYNLDYGTPAIESGDTPGDTEKNLLLKLSAALSGSTDGESPLTCYISKNYIRVEQLGLGGGITLADKRDTISYMLDTLEKTVTSYPAEMPNLQIQESGDSVAVLSTDDLRIHLTPDTMTIAGMHCQKAVFQHPEKEEYKINVWYTTELPALYWQKYSYLKAVPGCALAVTTKSGGLEIGIKAQRIEKLDIPEKFFLPPADYTLTIYNF